jgi:hypothetical protein
MVKIIETNLTMDGEIINDHQSRVIAAESWESFIEEIKNARFVMRTAIIGVMYGNSVPRSSKIENFISDEKHLSCDIYNYAGVKTRKLAYLIEGEEI